jgi:hypothetical protein
MKEVLLKKVLLFMLIISGSSCHKEEPDITVPVMIEIETSTGRRDSLLADAAGISYEMMEAALPFRAALRNNQQYRSAVYVYDSKSVTGFLEKPKELAARIALLGIKDIYLSIGKNAMSGSDVVRTNWLRLFNKYAHEFGLKVWALRLASYAQFANDQLIIDECEQVIAYNNAVAPDERFDGVSADWEPHVLKEGGVNTPPGMNYFWDSSKNYGVGGSNDMLLKRTLEMLNLARANLYGLPLNEAIHYMYQNNFNSGNLSYGSTLQFLESCEFITVMCYTDTREKVWSRGLTPVENAKGKPGSVSICVKTSLNTYGDDGDVTTSLHLKGWTYLINALNYFYTQGATKPAFRGIDFFEYEGLEIMWRDFVES